MNQIRAKSTEPPREIALKTMLSFLTPALNIHLHRELMTAERPAWKYLTAHFLHMRRASFMWRFAIRISRQDKSRDIHAWRRLWFASVFVRKDI
ncbi:hypothetical protein V5799_019945 [Amblyomma americanum]|uniref:Uncharacterized protein n=1 Tax=Amblyomma americanum TaxID=6943 RepID=A0AAQ4EVU6_AMBAM